MPLVNTDEIRSLSVVIPVYNKRYYLERCVESVLEQTYTELEVILVDDGSTDGSDRVCEALKDDRRVQVISQENQGVASARKKGIEKAKGRYVVFVDADDFLESGYLERLMDTVGTADLVTSGYFIGVDTSSPVFDRIRKGLYHTREQLDYVIDNMIIFNGSFEQGITPYIWNKLFRTDLAKQIAKEVDTDAFIGEDSEFLYRYLLKCDSIKITDICGYHYCDRKGSIVNSKHDRYLFNLNALYLSLKTVFEGHRKRGSLMRQLQVWTSMGIRNAPYVMDFYGLAQFFLRYIFPLYEEMKGKYIIIYGAGSVGKDYYLQLRNRKDITLVGWLDGAAEKYRENGYPLLSIEDIALTGYDHIVIAVKSEKMAMEIQKELLDKGIEKEKLVWKAPIRIEL